MNKNDIVSMFGESAGRIENDMNAIVQREAGAQGLPGIAPGGRPGAEFHPTTEAEIVDMHKQCQVVLTTEGSSPEQVQFCNAFLNTYPAPSQPGTPTAGSMLDLSSPVNTIAKAIFLMGISSMITGPSYYILNFFCACAIIYSTIKLSNK